MTMDDKQLEAKKKRFLAKIDGSDPLEKDIEKKWNKIAEKNGWVVRKFKSVNNNGVPDRIYFRDGVCFMIEFKRKNKEPTEVQQKEHKVLREQGGMLVLVIDRIDKPLAEVVFL
jgi:hypothetical protein